MQNQSSQQFDKKRSGRRSRRDDKPKDDFQSTILDLARVTRVQRGGKRMRFRTTVVAGDGKGQVGIGTAKGSDVVTSIHKATRVAKKNLIKVDVSEGTIAYTVWSDFKAARVMLKPAPVGRGVVAGGVMRSILAAAGVGNLVGKSFGSANKVNLAKATIAALKKLNS